MNRPLIGAVASRGLRCRTSSIACFTAARSGGSDAGRSIGMALGTIACAAR